MFSVHHQNPNFTHHIYQAAQTRGHAYHSEPFRMTNTLHEQQDFHHRGFSRSDTLLYSTLPHEYCSHDLHNSIITTNNSEAIPYGQARGTSYESSLLSSIMIKQTMIWVHCL